MLTQAAKLTLNDANRADLAAEIQEAITEVLVSKALTAMTSSGINRLVVAGGVSANQRLRERFAQARTRQEFEVSFPPISLCSDNGAMIALAGAFRLTGAHSIAAMSALDDDQIRAAVARDNPQIGPDQVPQFDIQPRWPIDSLEPVCGN